MPYSTLSKLENGKMAMTYDKLVAVAQGLGVDIGSLIIGAEASLPATEILGRRSVSRAGQWCDANSERVVHHYPATDLLNKLMVPVIIDVNARSVDEMGGLVRHAGEEYLYVLAGAMELHSDLYSPLSLGQGDSVYFDSGMAHAYVRTSDEPCRVLAMCAGGTIQQLSQYAAKGGKFTSAHEPGGSPKPTVSNIET